MNTKYIFIPCIFFLLFSCSQDSTELKIKPENLYPISVNEKWGYINKFAELVIPLKYDFAGHFKKGLAIVDIGKRRFYIDKNGNYIRDYEKNKKKYPRKYFFTSPQEIQNNDRESINKITTFRKDEKYGYKDKNGKVIIEPKYEIAGDFNEGLAVVSVNGQFGYINKNDEFIIQAKYDATYRFSNGFAAVEIDGLWGYINKQGEMTIDPQYDRAYSFDEHGIAQVVTNMKTLFINKAGDEEFVVPSNYKCNIIFSHMMNGYSVIYKSLLNSKAGLIDRNGKTILEPDYELVRYISDGLASVYKDEKWGFVNRSGEIVIEPKYEHTSYFSDGLAYFSENERYGFIDTNGDVVIEPRFKNVQLFAEGLPAVSLENELRGYIDKSGKYVIKPKFEIANQFSEDLAAVSIDGEKYGFIDKSGEFKIEKKFESARSFSEGFAQVWINKKCGYINKKGKLVLDTVYEDCRKFSSGVAAVSKDSETIYINIKGEKIADFKSFYPVPFDFSDGLLAFVDNEIWYLGKWGYLDKKGEVTIQPQYKSAYRFSEGLACVETFGKSGYINTKGQWIWKPTR
jgi:hypothetical protein